MSQQQHTFALEFLRLLPLDQFNTIIDIGSGAGLQTKWFVDQGKQATAFDLVAPQDASIEFVSGNIMTDVPFKDGTFDAVWSHHALEHMSMPLHALCNMRYLIKDDGWLFLTVPQIDDVISSGHIVSYNMPLLIYHLAIVGFDCRNGYMMKQRSHLRVAVKPYKGYIPRRDLSNAKTSVSELSKDGHLPASVQTQVLQTGRFTKQYLKTKWLDGKQYTYTKDQ